MHFTGILPKDSPPLPQPTIWDMVIADMKQRDAFGTVKYGKPLLPHDSRRTIHDAYQEALDLCIYLKKYIVEHPQD